MDDSRITEDQAVEILNKVIKMIEEDNKELEKRNTELLAQRERARKDLEKKEQERKRQAELEQKQREGRRYKINQHKTWDENRIREYEGKMVFDTFVLGLFALLSTVSISVGFSDNALLVGIPGINDALNLNHLVGGAAIGCSVHVIKNIVSYIAKKSIYEVDIEDLDAQLRELENSESRGRSI